MIKQRIISVLVVILVANAWVGAKVTTYNILDFGAKNNGKELTTVEIQHAIDRCYRDGGGVVTVPKGEYLVGTLNLKSSVEFHFEKGAILTHLAA